MSPVVMADPKDLRSYEHDRQRVKHATDFAKMRARRGQWSSKFDDPPKDTGAWKLARWALRETDSSSEGGFLFDFEHDTRPEVTVDSRLEVSLAALVTTRKPRKGRGMCYFRAPRKRMLNISAVEGDFEIIPHVRPVIALDDDMAPDVEVDEPWEHIYGDDDEYPDKEPSYATIASLN